MLCLLYIIVVFLIISCLNYIHYCCATGTVLFADIAGRFHIAGHIDCKCVDFSLINSSCCYLLLLGFTAWSSVREPAAVFTLLETLYLCFDEIANRRSVFKGTEHSFIFLDYFTVWTVFLTKFHLLRLLGAPMP